jgi:hypothetical protein
MDRKYLPKCAVDGCIRTATITEAHNIFNSRRLTVIVPLCDTHKE